MNKAFRLSPEPRTFSAEFDVPAHAVGLIPEIVVDGKGNATVSDFEMEFTDAEKFK